MSNSWRHKRADTYKLSMQHAQTQSVSYAIVWITEWQLAAVWWHQAVTVTHSHNSNIRWQVTQQQPLAVTNSRPITGRVTTRRHHLHKHQHSECTECVCDVTCCRVIIKTCSQMTNNCTLTRKRCQTELYHFDENSREMLASHVYCKFVNITLPTEYL